MQTQKKQVTGIIATCALAAIFIFSIALLLPEKHVKGHQARLKELTSIITKDEHTERIDYVDENNQLTIATDFGYATVVSTFSECSKIEHFYDEKGEPVSIYPGCYAILKEYNDDKQCIIIQYLDARDMPVMTQEGYSGKHLTYYDSGKIKTEKYYDTNSTPVCTSAYGYGLQNEYDENGRIVKITYLDKQDQPMLTRRGFAETRIIYDSDDHENGKAESEMYYNEKGIPVALSLGQYGIHKEYDNDGLKYIVTYLDNNGKPTVTTAGYTKVVRTYHDDYSLKEEMYYDLEGNPFELSEGQYGIKKENNQVVYLNQNGAEKVNLKRLLYNNPWIIVPCAFLVIILSGLLNKRLNIFLAFAYTAVVVYLTLMYREQTESDTIGLFMHYRRLFMDREARISILMNIWLFIPVGAILYSIYPRKIILLIPILMSCLIEGFQLLTRTGYCEIDDIVSNTLGGAIGFAAEKWMMWLQNRYRKGNMQYSRLIL